MKTTHLAMALLAAVLSAPAMGGGESQTTFTVEPYPPREGHALRLRIDDEAGCFVGGPQSFVTREVNQVLVKFYAVDHACPDAFRTPLTAPLGVFGAGNYALTIQLCPVPPLPCDVVATQGLVVLPALRRQQISTLSPLGLGGTIVLFLAVAMVRRRYF